MKNRKSIRIAVLVLILAIISIVGWRGYQAWQLRLVDERIFDDVAQVVSEELRSQSADSTITARYGRFEKWVSFEGFRSTRPAIQKVKYQQALYWRGIAKFEKARARVSIKVDGGPSLQIENLEMLPSEAWVMENSAEVRMGGHGMLHVSTDWSAGYGVSHFDGRAKHPDFVARE